jgi:hypothetical protein
MPTFGTLFEGDGFAPDYTWVQAFRDAGIINKEREV